MRTNELLSGTDTATLLARAEHVNGDFHNCGIKLPIVDGQGQVGPGADDKVIGPARFN